MTAQRKRNRTSVKPNIQGFFTVRSIRRDPPDIHKLVKVITQVVAPIIQEEEAPSGGDTTTPEPVISAEDKYLGP